MTSDGERIGAAAEPDPADGTDERLTLVLDGYEGPLDALLDLARAQRVDLTKISILALVDQYLAFVERVRSRRLELAADHLVMAAWLAYLKSRILLPEPDEEEPSGEELAAGLAFQLRRLEAMRDAAAALGGRPRLGLARYARGAPETLETLRVPTLDLDLAGLLRAYADVRRREATAVLRVEPERLHTIEEALERLSVALGRMPDWTRLESFAPRDPGSLAARSALAAHLAAALELARDGKLEIRQDRPFTSVWIRSPVGNGAEDRPSILVELAPDE